MSKDRRCRCINARMGMGHRRSKCALNVFNCSMNNNHNDSHTMSSREQSREVELDDFSTIDTDMSIVEATMEMPVHLSQCTTLDGPCDCINAWMGMSHRRSKCALNALKFEVFNSKGIIFTIQN